MNEQVGTIVVHLIGGKTLTINVYDESNIQEVKKMVFDQGGQWTVSAANTMIIPHRSILFVEVTEVKHE